MGGIHRQKFSKNFKTTNLTSKSELYNSSGGSMSLILINFAALDSFYGRPTSYLSAMLREIQCVEVAAI